MNIFLDENMPEGLTNKLSDKGHTVQSVAALNKKGIENGAVLKEAEGKFDLLFTRDAKFAQRFHDRQRPRIIHVTIHQARANAFIPIFMEHFEKTDWSRIQSGDTWPFTVPRPTTRGRAKKERT